jgi:hypothetical protein
MSMKNDLTGPDARKFAPLTTKMDWVRGQSRYLIVYDPYCNWGKGAFVVIDRMVRTMLDDEFPTQQRAVEYLYEEFATSVN